MAGPRLLEKGFQFWPQQADALPVAEVVKLYESGFAGAVYEPDELDEFNARNQQMFGTANGDDIPTAAGWAESGAGKLVIPFLFILKYFANCLPGPAQQRGDCVSHNEKNACLFTLCCDIAAGLPDQETGIVEGVPDVPEQGIKQGVLSSEWSYWWRGYSGDGWSCAASANVSIKRGVMLRKPYPELGIDLTSYSGRLAGQYGRQSPPANMAAEGARHLVRGAIQVSGFEAIRDYLANGYGIGSCGSEGFSSQRDENGVSRRSGRWSHAMAIIGADDRDEIKAIYKEPLLLVQNSWGVFNSGPRLIRGTNYEIPAGSFWARWSDVRNRYFVAHSSVNGWPSKRLPDWGFSLAG